MDNQNPGMPGDPNQGGGEPADQSTPPAPEQPMAAADEKCTTCGAQASGGNCVPCGQGEASCACPPASPPTGDMGQNQPTGGDQSTSSGPAPV